MAYVIIFALLAMVYGFAWALCRAAAIGDRMLPGREK